MQWRWPILLALGIIVVSGCAERPSTSVVLVDPRIVIHSYDEPVLVQKQLKSDELSISSRAALPSTQGDFSVKGVGRLVWGKHIIVVERNRIRIGNETVDSKVDGTFRNVIMQEDGSIERDKFIPFEPSWSHH